MRRICVFCGSSAGLDPIFRQSAEALGKILAERGIGVVYGAGNIGLMGVVADAALAAGGQVTGVIPRALCDRELAHREIQDLRVVETMHERKAMMADLSDAFIALPGGFGTLEEFCEIVTWAQLGIHGKPCGLLNVGGYYDPLLAQLDAFVSHEFLSRQNRGLVIDHSDPVELLAAFARYEAPELETWLDRTQT